MNHKSSYDTDVQELGLFSFLTANNDLNGHVIVDDSPKPQIKKSPSIPNKKEIVLKLIKHFKTD